MFLPEIRGTGSGRRDRKSQNDDVGVSYYKDDAIDLGEVMREQFFLALPMKPLVPAGLPGALSGVRRESQPRACDVPRVSGWTRAWPV